MSTRDAMLQAFNLAKTNLDNYKQVEKEWHMNEEVKPKRPRGNPNFVKKNKPDEGGPVGILSTTPTPLTYKYQYVESEGDIWLKLYAAIISTYSTAGGSMLVSAASNADAALKEYKTRYPK